MDRFRRYLLVWVLSCFLFSCASTAPRLSDEPLTSPLEAISKKPKTTGLVPESQRAPGYTITNEELGKVRYLSTGFSTFEGDFCRLFISIEHGFVATYNGTWSGHDCPWPKEGRHVPLDREAVRALRDVIDDSASNLKVHQPPQSREDMMTERTLTSTRDEFDLDERIEDTMVAQTNRLLDRWLGRELEDMPRGFSAVASLNGRFVRATLEPHGVLVMTITDPGGSKNRLWVLDDEELGEIRELVRELPPSDWAEAPGDADRNIFMVATKERGLVKYWPESAPASIHRLLELTALREHP